MVLKLLNNTQKEELRNVINFYKFFYICNLCGRLYGSDNKDFTKECPICLPTKRKEDKE